ncbi:MAG: hypothetical protein JSW55_03810, partial [Chloroflexota bacterium]
MSEDLNDDPVATRSTLEQAALLLGQSDDEALLDAVLDGIMNLTGAGQIYLLVEAPETGRPKLLRARDTAGDLTSSSFDNGAPPDLEGAMPIGQARLTPPTVTIPLMCAGRSLGLIHATGVRPDSDESVLPALQALANQAASAIDRTGLMASLSSLEKAQTEFVSLTTHQLRVPLTSISGYTDL